jgi:hypothetical protein
MFQFDSIDREPFQIVSKGFDVDFSGITVDHGDVSHRDSGCRDELIPSDSSGQTTCRHLIAMTE